MHANIYDKGYAQIHSNVHYVPTKSVYTQTLELITKTALHAPQKIHFRLGEGASTTLYADINNHSYNVSDLMKKANFSEISLDALDGEKYLNLYGKSDYHYNGSYESEKYQALSAGEQLAITHYTGSGAYNTNAFLYGNTQYFDSNYLEVDYWAKHMVADTVLLASGLNKIPSESHVSNQQSYRGESELSDEQLACRIEAIHNKSFTEEPAMMSTSTDKNVAMDFSDGHSLIIFDKVYGKPIEGLSFFRGESEYLMPPSKIQWTSYEYKNGMHIFHAKQIADLPDQDDSVGPESLEAFKDLLIFAQNEGIPHHPSDVLQLDDVITMASIEDPMSYAPIEQSAMPHYSPSAIMPDYHDLQPLETY